jgi:hypothetical protein
MGNEGAPVLIGKKKVGHLCTEEYGSKILSLGGVNLLTGKDGIAVARVIVDIANRREVRLKIEDGAELAVRVGNAPVIDGETGRRMRVGCGSASMGLFGRYFLDAADEVIVLDAHLIGQFTEHAAGRELGATYSGIRVKARRSTAGRYFGEHGRGWGGTPIEDPIEIIEGFDPKIAKPGMTVLITETTAERAAMFRLGDPQSQNGSRHNCLQLPAIKSLCHLCGRFRWKRKGGSDKGARQTQPGHSSKSGKVDRGWGSSLYPSWRRDHLLSGCGEGDGQGFYLCSYTCDGCSPRIYNEIGRVFGNRWP